MVASSIPNRIFALKNQVMKKKSGFFLLAFLGATGISAQSEQKDFFVIKDGAVSENYTQDPLKNAEAEAKKQTIVAEKDALPVYKSASFEIDDMINSGVIYVNDELSPYLQSIVNKLYAVKPGGTDVVKVLLSRHTNPNAFCFLDGTVIVNVGLVAALENEDQLAGVLAHELSHYSKKHSLNKIKRGKELEKQEEESDSKTGIIFRSLQYSRENEFEADASGIVWLSQTSYNANEYEKALSKVTTSFIDSIPLNLSELFNSDKFTVDTNFITRKNIEKELKKSNTKNKSIIGDNEELFETHPDSEKRMLAVSEILKSLEYKTPTNSENVQYAEFYRKAQFEVCENEFSDGRYLESLHSALKLMTKYPESNTASLLVVKNLYWLCRLKENGVLGEFLSHANLEKSPSMAKLKLFFDKTKSNDLGKFLYTYVKRESERKADNSDLLFYLGASAEMHLGKDAAAIHYRSYAVKYPQGRFIAYVSTKID